MSVVLKIGGSILRDVESCNTVVQTLEELVDEEILVMTGGGELADVIRQVDDRLSVSSAPLHWAAIETMHINARIFSALSESFHLVEDYSPEIMTGDRIPVTGGYDILQEYEPDLPENWDVTSDSIAVSIASYIGANRAVLVKSTDGLGRKGNRIDELSTSDLRHYAGEVVDVFLPEVIEDTGIPCIVLSCEYPERIEAAVKGEDVEGALISPESGGYGEG